MAPQEMTRKPFVADEGTRENDPCLVPDLNGVGKGPLASGGTTRVPQCTSSVPSPMARKLSNGGTCKMQDAGSYGHANCWVRRANCWKGLGLATGSGTACAGGADGLKDEVQQGEDLAPIEANFTTGQGFARDRQRRVMRE